MKGCGSLDLRSSSVRLISSFISLLLVCVLLIGFIGFVWRVKETEVDALRGLLEEIFSLTLDFLVSLVIGFLDLSVVVFFLFSAFEVFFGWLLLVGFWILPYLLVGFDFFLSGDFFADFVFAEPALLVMALTLLCLVFFPSAACFFFFGIEQIIYAGTLLWQEKL